MRDSLAVSAVFLIIIIILCSYVRALGPLIPARSSKLALSIARARVCALCVVHTGERAAILKLNFHEFDEKELLRAEFL